MGLNPIELKELKLWEFNQYVRAYQDKLKENEKNTIKGSYYTAYFNKIKKAKSLKHYLGEVDSIGRKKPKRDKEKLNFAKKMYEKINSPTKFDKNQ